jgi:hypothetical protein
MLRWVREAQWGEKRGCQKDQRLWGTLPADPVVSGVWTCWARLLEKFGGAGFI